MPLLPLLGGGLAGAIQGLAGYLAEAAQARRLAQAQQQRRQMLRGFIDEELLSPDFSGLDRQMRDVYTQAAGALGSQQAGMGMMDQPLAQRTQSDLFSNMLSQLAGARAEDLHRRHSLAAQLMQDPSFGVPSPDQLNPTFGGGVGALLGGAAGGALGVLPYEIKHMQRGNNGAGTGTGTGTGASGPSSLEFGVGFPGVDFQAPQGQWSLFQAPQASAWPSQFTEGWGLGHGWHPSGASRLPGWTRR